LQDVEVVGQFKTGTSSQTHLFNSKISVGTASGKVCTHTHTHTYIYIYLLTYMLHIIMDTYIHINTYAQNSPQ